MGAVANIPDTQSQQSQRLNLTQSLARGALLKSPRFWLGLTWFCYALFLACLTVCNAIGPEKWWPTTLNLYLPQWIWSLPGFALTVLMARWARRWCWASVPLLIWTFGPLMGFCFGRLSSGLAPGGSSFRVLTYNVKYGRGDVSAIIREIDAARPDLVLIQDAAQAMNGPLGTFLNHMTVRSFGQYVIASRLPISDAQVRWISFPGAQHSCLRCSVHIGGREIAVYDVHLLTPRDGLAALRSRDENGIGELQLNAASRLVQARRLAEQVVGESVPVIVAGDLNAPGPSIVCQTLRQAGLHDGFEQGGWGYGYTYGHTTRLAHSYVRIDHIMLSRELRAERCWTGGAGGSDHRPVIADVTLAPHR